jgi:hypothetical protein
MKKRPVNNIVVVVIVRFVGQVSQKINGDKGK